VRADFGSSSYVKEDCYGHRDRLCRQHGERRQQSKRRGSISADGRFVAFSSFADNLVAGDTNGTYDVFVKDLQTGTITRVSTDSAGTQGNSASLNPPISADGRFVAFDSEASNLVADDTNGHRDVFVKDLQTLRHSHNSIAIHRGA
jgi:Tol biopolymer transport system component